MDFYIVTGTSRGIGEAIVKRLIRHGNTIFCVSRTINEDLVDTASALHIPLYYHEADLSLPASADEFLHEVFSRIDPERAGRIALINNAGMLDPVAPIELVKPEQIEKHLQLNLLAPMILISGFIHRTAFWQVPKVVLNISSGASTFPYAGWAAYCTSKAGLDMLTRTVGLEQSKKEHPVKMMAVAPGIVDTAMQTQIRHTDSALFGDRQSFIRLHEEGRLSNPDTVAGIITASLFNPDIPQGSVLTIDQLKAYTV